MNTSITLPHSYFGEQIIDSLAETRVRLQIASAAELADLLQVLIKQGYVKELALLEWVGEHGGIIVRAHCRVVLARHSQVGNGEHLWDRQADATYKLVGGSNV